MTMKVKIIGCTNKDLWYNNKSFPIETEVIEALDYFKESDYKYYFKNNIFFDKYELQDFYYSKELMGYISKEDCVPYLISSRPWEISASFPTTQSYDDIWNKVKVKPKTEEIVIVEETKKNDQGKPDFTLIPQEALLEVAKVFTLGADKYGKDNYSIGTNYRRYIAACHRHVNQWLRGEDIDEIGTNHLANAIASLMMVLDNQLTNKGVDDRNRVYKK